jgi:cytochrome P450
MVVYDMADPRASQDPWPLYEALRREAPVSESPMGFFVLARHADCLALLRDRRASSDGTRIDPDRAPAFTPVDEVANAALGDLTQLEQDNRPFLFRDPPDHTRLRGLVQQAFTPKMVEGLRPRVAQVVDELLDRALEEGQVDLVDALAYPLPVRIICDLLGVPAEDQDRFKDWSAALARGLDPDFLLSAGERQSRMEAVLSFAAYFFELLADRRAHPGDDLLSQLARAEAEGDRLNEGELLSTCILLLVGGHETTVNLIAGGVLALLQAPDQLVRLRDDPGLTRPAVEELLRYVSPIQWTGRALLDDVEVAGTVLPKGAFVVTLLGSANRDAEAFADPARLDLSRSDNRHLGFGFGVHHCLGAPLARLEAGVALPALLSRAPGLALATDTIRWRENVVLRGLVDLPVSLRAA